MKKKNIGILLTLLTLAISSCTSEVSTPKEEPNLLIAKWHLEKSSFNGVPHVLTACDKQSYIEFKSNKTFERIYYYSSNGTDCLPEGTDNGTYVFDSEKNKITLSFTDPDDGAQTEILNNINLTTSILKYTWDENGDGTDDVNAEYKK
nr:lipocalin family protein [uncultured Flavobacterium sp.]